MNRRLLTALIPAVAFLMLLGTAAPAAAVTTEQRLSVLSSWTQTSTGSYNAWKSARQDRSSWAEYAFDWSTDLCSSSPDNPLGFDFRLSCHRHDFGYRNYHAVGQFNANKARLDDAFYADLRRKCATYSSVVRPACYSLAWVYYQAVRQFGDIIITPDQVAQAAELLPTGERAART